MKRFVFLILFLILVAALCALPAPAHAQGQGTLVFSDSFDRPDTVANGVGNGWVDPGRKYRIAGNALAADPIKTPFSHPPLVRPTAEKTLNVLVSASLGPWANGASPSYRLHVRYINGSNSYIADVNLGNGGTPIGAIGIKKMVAGITSDITSQNFPILAGHRYRVDFSAVGILPTSLSATVYDLGESGSDDPIPVSVLTVTDSAQSLQASGSTGIGLGWYVWNLPNSTGIGSVDRFEVSSVETGGGNEPVFFPFDDARIFYSPYNWWSGRTSVCGAYLKTRFFGSSCRLRIDTSHMASMPSAHYPRIAFSVDGKPFIVTQITPGQTQIHIASGISEGGHDLFVYVYGNSQLSDLWGSVGADPVNHLKIEGVLLNPGMTLASPTILPKRILAYGDSITRTAYSVAGGADADALPTWAFTVANALDAEIGVIAHAGQGWQAGVAGGSNVPPFGQSWDRLNAKNAVDYSVLPDYILINQGRNGSVSATEVTRFLADVRAKVGASPVLCLVIPFAGTNRSPITTGFDAYLASSGDGSLCLIDTATDYWFTGITIHTPDAIHPNKWTHGLLGSKVAALLASAQRSCAGSAQLRCAGRKVGFSGGAELAYGPEFR